MKTIWRVLPIVLCLFCAQKVLAQETVWQTVDPGGNGGATFTSIHPATGHLFTASDMTRSLFRSTNQGETWEPIANPVTGTPDYVACDPSEPFTLYMRQDGVTPKASGMWKSTDNGDTWEQISNDPRFGRRNSSHSGVVDPDNGQILYWSAGDRGILRSADAGRTWADWSQGLPKAKISFGVRFAYTLKIDQNSPLQNRRIFYPTNQGLFQASEPEGVWTLTPNLPESNCTDLKICNGGILYAALPGEGLFKSVDNGKNWKMLSGGIEGKTVERVAATNDRPDMLYVGVVGAERSFRSDFGADAVYGSRDGGESFELLTRARFNADSNWPINYRQAEGVAVREIFVAPNDPLTVYVVRGIKSHDGGRTWMHYGMKEIRQDRWRGSGLPLLTQYRAVFDPQRNNRVWLGFSDTGLMFSEDGGETVINAPSFHRGEVNQAAYWRDKLVLSSGSCYSIAVDPDQSTTVYASLSGKAYISRISGGGILLKTVDGGWNWKAIHEKHGLDDGIVRTVILDPTSPIDNRTLYVASFGNGVYKSVDDGKTFKNVGPGKVLGPNKRIMDLAMAASDSRRLYLSVGGSNGVRPLFDMREGGYLAVQKEMYGGVFKTADGGMTWSKCNTTREIPSVQSLAVHPGNADIVYAAAFFEDFLVPDDSPHPEWKEGGVFKTKDGGKTWDRVFAPPDDDWTGRGDVQSVCINPVCPEIVYAAVQNYGIYRTLDDGKTWEPVGKASMDRRQRTYFSVQVNPHDPAEVWVGHFGNAFSKGIDYKARAYMEQKFLKANFVANPGFETLDENGMPTHWSVEQPPAPRGEQPVFSVSRTQVKEGSHTARFHLTQAYREAPSTIAGYREQARLEREGIVAGKTSGLLGQTKTWIGQTINPYFTTLMRGKRIAVEMDVFIAEGNPALPQVFLTEARDYNVHWVVAETYLEDLPEVAKHPLSEAKGKWHRVRSEGRVTENAHWLRITVTGVGARSSPMEAYVDNVRLSLAE